MRERQKKRADTSQGMLELLLDVVEAELVAESGVTAVVVTMGVVVGVVEFAVSQPDQPLLISYSSVI